MKNKVSPLTELRAERIKLTQESKDLEESLKYHFSYAKHNLGSLLLSSVLPSPKGIKDTLFGFGNRDSKSSVFEKISVFAPTIWNIAQPILLGLLTKRLASKFLKKKKKKKK